eukprot:jgi/Tetstr1/444337/TSEL_032228.t1
MEDPREFHNAQPRSREEREAGNDKDSFEKLRLQQRTGGFYSPNCVPNPVAAVQESSQYATEAERFNRDFARDEYERRKAKNLAEEERLARKRYEVYEREKDRWDTMDTGYAKQEEANLGCTTRPIHKNNAGGDPVHILTMRYKDNDAGHDLKYSDDRTKWRGEMRREKIWQKQQSQDHNIITGLKGLVDRKREGQKGKQYQDRLAKSMLELDAAFTNTNCNWQRERHWPECLKHSKSLRGHVSRYYKSLCGQNKRHKVAHAALDALRDAANAVKFTLAQPLRADDETVPVDVFSINNKLLDSDVNDYMVGLDKRKRFMQHLKAGLATPFHLWSWMPGGSQDGFAAHFIWCVSLNLKARADNMNEDARLVAELTASQERYYSRAVTETFSCLCLRAWLCVEQGGSASNLRVCHRSRPPNSGTASKVGLATAVFALSSQCKDLILDLRQPNGRPDNKLFHPFWDALHTLMDENYKRVHDRRHEGMFLPIAVSVRLLVEKTVKRLQVKHATAEHPNHDR